MKSRSNSYLVLFIAIMAVSTAAILIRFALEEANPIVVAMYRLAIATLFTLILIAINGRKLYVRIDRKSWLLIVASGVMLALHFAAWIISLDMINVSSSTVLITTTPIWVAIVSPLILGEKNSHKILPGLFLAIFGGLIIAAGSVCSFTGANLTCGEAGKLLGGHPLGYFLSLSGAWFATGYMLIGRKLSKALHTLDYTLRVYAVATLILIILVLFLRLKIYPLQPRTLLALLALGLIPQVMGHTLLNHSMKTLPVLTVSIALLGEPIGSTILAILLLNEKPTSFELIGGLIILIGVVLVILAQSQTNAASPDQQFLPRDGA